MQESIINNSQNKSVKATVGKHIKDTREAMHISRQEFCDAINNSNLCPMKNGQKEYLNVERLKQWEYGNNPVDLEWIPALCNALSIDVGFLFGDYEEKTRQISDVVKETGLSSDAVALLRIFKNSPVNIGFIDGLILFCGINGKMLQKISNAIGSRKKISASSFSSSNYLFMESIKDSFGVNVEGSIKIPPGAVPLEAAEASEFYIDYASRLFREFLSDYVKKESQTKEAADNGE